MIKTSNFKDLKKIEEAIFERANYYGRNIPEIRFFVLDSNEFMSLLEKNVYPVSPINIWEGKNVIKRKFNSEMGRDTGIFYEVVQCGNPSYAYLNENNSLTTQASVMAHVIGHCEFSELNVLKNSDNDRTEKIIYLTKKIDNSVKSMGFFNYTKYWNACESIIPLVSPNSQYNLNNSVETDLNDVSYTEDKKSNKNESIFNIYSSTLDKMLTPIDSKKIYKKDEENKEKRETINRYGYKLKAPCQDILGFLRKYAPASDNEKNILEYMYLVSKQHNFIIKTQIMNEGWAMYWEKKIMADLFKDNVVKDIIDYCRIFSGVCRPRPFFMRNPYHMGYYMWKHIEDLYSKGKISINYVEEKDRETKEKWDKNGSNNPIENMGHLVRTITDYEFIRRFLDKEMINNLSLNKLDLKDAEKYGFLSTGFRDNIISIDKKYVYVNQDFVKNYMLKFFSDFNRPMIYIIDTDYKDGGLVLYHRHNGIDLKQDWIAPTLMNINTIWRSPVYLYSGNLFHRVSGKDYDKKTVPTLDFDEIKEKMFDNKKPFTLKDN